MNKQKYFVLVLMIITVIGSSYFFWMYFGKSKVPKPSASSQVDESYASPSSLSIAQNNAMDLGQIPLNSMDGNTSRPNSPAQKSVLSEPNPATFKDYDKYKDATSGLFGEIKVGDGITAEQNNKVAIVYKGWLTDGTLFDSSQKDADGKYQALVFALGGNEIIPGLQQGIGGMKVGGSRIVIVPPAVGYGPAGKDKVPPNAVMVFFITLLAVE